MRIKKMSNEVIVLFKDGFNFVELKITLEDLVKNSEEELFEMLEDRENPCTCTLSESQSFCECQSAFDNFEIVGVHFNK